MNPEEKYIALMKTHFKVTCVCTKCDKRQVLKIDDLLSGITCRLGKFGDPCGGEFNYYASDVQTATENALSVLAYLNVAYAKTWPASLAILADTVLDDVQTWAESSQSPREMGWVGTNGLP